MVVNDMECMLGSQLALQSVLVKVLVAFGSRLSGSGFIARRVVVDYYRWASVRSSRVLYDRCPVHCLPIPCDYVFHGSWRCFWRVITSLIDVSLQIHKCLISNSIWDYALFGKVIAAISIPVKTCCFMRMRLLSGPQPSPYFAGCIALTQLPPMSKCPSHRSFRSFHLHCCIRFGMNIH
jgi:hypothetical protein